MAADISIRRARADDRSQILAVAARALGWAGDERDRKFLSWKHDENPFGRSPAWVAVSGTSVVAYRMFLRWDLERDGEQRRLVRAVDTATDPAHQRQGLFRRLTSHAVEEMENEGVDAVFNTPNAASRAGYLTMGWTDLGRPNLGLALRNPWIAPSLRRSLVASQKWSEEVSLGAPAAEALADTRIPPDLSRAGRWSTARTGDYLRWRYSFAPLNYRAVEVRGGICIFRVRRRGPNREVVICEWLSTRPDPRGVRRIVRSAGDYAVGLGVGWRRHGTIPLPRKGPQITWRSLCWTEVPSLRELDFSLGDIELF